jgi:hypothetical protein
MAHSGPAGEPRRHKVSQKRPPQRVHEVLSCSRPAARLVCHDFHRSHARRQSSATTTAASATAPTRQSMPATSNAAMMAEVVMSLDAALFVAQSRLDLRTTRWRAHNGVHAISRIP